MFSDTYNRSDTITAISTPPGNGAIAVIRISGNNAIEIVNKIFPSKELSGQNTHSLHVGTLKFKNAILDEVVIALFKAPKSYTGEDIVEISCHGSYYIQQEIISVLIESGARLAEAGEFTQRAFLNGKLDLAQAESVAELISAQSQAGARNALTNMRGGFSNQLKELRGQLIQFCALIELELDFSQEDVEFANRTQLLELINKAIKFTAHLIHSFQLGNAIKNGINIAITGRPNAGKSTLLNTLLNDDRAIVSEMPGTTRDTIEELLNIQGILFKFIDTAGIRDTQDIIEEKGIRKTYEAIQKANIVLYIFDISKTILKEVLFDLEKLNIHDKHKIFILANKEDLKNKAAINCITDEFSIAGFQNFLSISLLSPQKEKLIAMEKMLFDMSIHDEMKTHDVIVTNTRHYTGLQEIHKSLRNIETGLKNNISGDLLSSEIKHCLHYIGVITGEVQIDRDILGTIFSKFCIGK